MRKMTVIRVVQWSLWYSEVENSLKQYIRATQLKLQESFFVIVLFVFWKFPAVFCFAVFIVAVVVMNWWMSAGPVMCDCLWPVSSMCSSCSSPVLLLAATKSFAFWQAWNTPQIFRLLVSPLCRKSDTFQFAIWHPNLADYLTIMKKN